MRPGKNEAFLDSTMKAHFSSFAGRGGYLVLAQLVLLLLIALIAPRTSGNWGGGLIRVLAAGMMLAGALVGIAGTWALGGNLTPFTKPKITGALVQDGVYSHIRHPLYLCQILMMTAWALWFASFWGVIANGFLALVFDRKARMEERALVAQFHNYTEYQSKVPRLFPRLRR